MKYLASMGARKELKTMSAPLSPVSAAQTIWKGRNVPEDGQRQPQKEDKFESVVEGEPVDDVDKALRNAALY